MPPAPVSLLPYQRRWVRDGAGLKICEKSRRIGMSWAEAYDAVMHAGAGRGNVYYQSYSHEMTRTFIDDCAEWAQRLNVAAEAVGQTLIKDQAGSVQAFRLRLASGRDIHAMPASPRIFRSKGRPGDIAVIDEAAFLDDLDETLKAALAFATWGGTVHAISTHNGEASPFNALVRDVRDGARAGSAHRITFRAALADGLHKRICAVQGKDWSPAAQDRWEADIRHTYGHHAAEELDCIPSAGSGAWLAWELIRAAEHPEAGAPERRADGGCFIGVDVARRRDLWVAVAIEAVGDVRWVRELRAERDIPFSAQHQIVADLVERFRPARIAVDQTGMGEEFVERLQERHGRHRVEGVLLTGPRRLDLATALRECLEDRRLRIPPDEALRRDLHAVRAQAGPTGAPRLIANRAGTDGHADRFWALALAVGAAASGPSAFDCHLLPPPLSSRIDRSYLGGLSSMAGHLDA